MSTLYADGQEENVILSLYNHIQGNYTLTPVIFVGQDEFNSEVADEWVEILWSMPGGKRIRTLGQGVSGMERHPTLSCVIRTKPTANLGRHHRIFDALCNALSDRSIPINDYVGGDGSQVGKLYVQDQGEHIELGRDGDVKVSVAVFQLQWQQAYGRS